MKKHTNIVSSKVNWVEMTEFRRQAGELRAKPKLRYPELVQRLAWRDFIRKKVPPGYKGYVAEDLDLVMRHFTPGEDPVGKFMLIEFKCGKSGLDWAQRKTFGLIDSLLRKADPGRRRYFGYYLLQYSNHDFNKCNFVEVNGKIVTKEGLLRFLRFELDINPYDFGALNEVHHKSSNFYKGNGYDSSLNKRLKRGVINGN